MLKILKIGIKNQTFFDKISRKHFNTSSVFLKIPEESSLKFLEKSVKNLRIYDEIDLSPADMDWNYLLNENNVSAIEENIQKRKGNGDIKTLVNCFTLPKHTHHKNNDTLPFYYKSILYIKISNRFCLIRID